jgi:hypothetical protein
MKDRILKSRHASDEILSEIIDHGKRNPPVLPIVRAKRNSDESLPALADYWAATRIPLAKQVKAMKDSNDPHFKGD